MAELFVNEYVSTWKHPVGASDGTVYPAGTVGAPGTTGYWRLRTDDEIMICTDSSGTAWPVLRGQENTSAVSHAQGGTVYGPWTQGAFDAAYLRKDKDQTFVNSPTFSGSVTFSGTVGLSAVQGTAQITNANAQYLQGQQWLNSINIASTANLTLGTVAALIPGASGTVTRAGYWTFIGMADLYFVGAGDNGVDLHAQLRVGGTTQSGECLFIGGTNGMRQTSGAAWGPVYVLSGGTVELYGLKGSGTGSSLAVGGQSKVIGIWNAP